MFVGHYAVEFLLKKGSRMFFGASFIFLFTLLGLQARYTALRCNASWTLCVPVCGAERRKIRYTAERCNECNYF